MKYYFEYYELETERVRTIYDILEEFEETDPNYLEELFGEGITFDDFMDIMTASGGQLVPVITPYEKEFCFQDKMLCKR